MVLVSFNLLKDKLLSGEKTQTIRTNHRLWRKRWEGGTRLLHIHWKSPRTRRHNKDQYSMGVARWTRYRTIPGSAFTLELAQADGFTLLHDLHRTLAEMNKITTGQVCDWYWAVLNWEWIEGPHQPPEGKP